MNKTDKYNLRIDLFYQLQNGLKPNVDYIVEQLLKKYPTDTRAVLVNIVNEATRAKDKLNMIPENEVDQEYLEAGTEEAVIDASDEWEDEEYYEDEEDEEDEEEYFDEYYDYGDDDDE